MSYVPKPETRAALALDFIEARLRNKARGEWLANTEVAEFLGCPTNAVRPSLEPAVEAGILERSLTSNRSTQWRLAVQKPRRAAPRMAAAPVRRFGLDNWPPGFVSQFDSIRAHNERRK